MNYFLKFRHGQVVFALFLGIFVTNAQPVHNLAEEEDKLVENYNSILQSNPYDRVDTAESFAQNFQEILSLPGAFLYPFDSLKKIGKVYSPDTRLRLITWNIPVEIDSNYYYALLMYKNHRDDNFTILKLKGNGYGPVGNTPITWSGALYYQVTETKHAGQKYYTLLGFDLHNIMSNKKVIDVIAIDEFDEVYLPEKLFSYERKILNRIEFEYNEQVAMVLRYDEKKKMIIFDHLSPDRPSQQGNFQFYGPDMTYDGLKFEKGQWVQYKNIDINN